MTMGLSVVVMLQCGYKKKQKDPWNMSGLFTESIMLVVDASMLHLSRFHTA